MYKLIVNLAYKSAFLRLSRTLLVVIMIAVSMGMMLSIQGIYDGMTLNMIDATKRSDSGEVSLFAPQYRLNKNLNDRIRNAVAIQKALKSEVDAVVLRTSVEGLGATARKSAFSNIIGINLEAEERFGHFSGFLKEGVISFEKRGAIVGSELAKTLKLKVGSKVIFSTQDSSGDINALGLRVRGIAQTSNVLLDATAIYVPREKLHHFLGIDNSDATQIAIRSQDNTLKKRLQEAYPKLDVKSFVELYPMLKQMQDMMMIFNSITFFIVMLVVFIGILGVMYVSIMDRIREFGIMQAVGMDYKYLRLQIVLEAIIVGCVGYISGAVLGALGLLYLQHFGLDLSHFAEGMERFGMSTIIYANIEIHYFIDTFMAIISASVLSVFFPLRKIKNLHPIDVIKVDT